MIIHFFNPDMSGILFGCFPQGLIGCNARSAPYSICEICSKISYTHISIKSWQLLIPFKSITNKNKKYIDYQCDGPFLHFIYDITKLFCPKSNNDAYNLKNLAT